MKPWAELNNLCKRHLHVELERIEQHPRHLVMLGVLPRLDIQAIERLMAERHPVMLVDGWSIADVVEAEYGVDAVEFIEQYAMKIEG